jgi:Ca2+-transporting ATPase
MENHPWHAFGLPDIESRLKTSLTDGLSREEASRRLAQGANRLPPPSRESFLMRFLRQFASPIAIVLLFAAGATLFLFHYTDALVIFLALFVNVIMGLVQEGRASRAFEALQKSEAKYAVVFRDGEPQRISADELVPGDLVSLTTGNAVPADIRLIETHSLSINEAALSGEWVAVEKSVTETKEEAPLVERLGMAHSGTLVVGGTGRGIVVETGARSELGRIAAELGKGRKTETPLMRDIREVARLLVGATIAILIVVLFLGYLREMPFGDMLFIAIALAVSSVPEGLPAAVTVVLALGMERILKKGGLVRNLLAAETLGTTSIILTDKTGTLTKGNIKAAGFATLSGTTEDADGKLAHAMLRAAVLASDGYIEEVDDPTPGEEKIVAHGRPVEQAILLSALRAGIGEAHLRETHPRIDILPFASERRFGSMLVKEDGTHVAYVTGAPEALMVQATHARTLAGTARLTKEYARQFEEALARSTREGKRVLAVGRLETKASEFPKDEDGRVSFFEGLELLGYIIFSDEIRAEAKDAVASMRDAGARVIMLTGDNPETALYVAQETGIADAGDRAYTGAELKELSDEQVLNLLRENRVFARVAPSDKLRIARILTGAGEVVAMTGDGVNDAPALEAASIGVAVGSGTDVAKEAADLVLLGDSFSVITHAIREGRRLRDNFKKIFVYMLSTNFSEVVLISFALLLGMPLPLLPTQILWSNLVEGGLMNFAYAFEPLYPSVMKRKPTDTDIRKVLSRKVLWLIGSVGVITAGFLAVVYLYLVQSGLPELEIQTLMFIGISISTMFTAFSMKSFGTPIWRIDFLSNKFLLVSVAGSMFLLWAALYVPMVQAIVKTVTPTTNEILFFVGVGLINLVTVEIAKWIIFIRPESKKAITPVY